MAIASLAASGCASAPAVQGFARMARVDQGMVLTFCESGESYGLGVSTSNAAPQLDLALERVRSQGEAYVDVSGHESTSSPSSAPGSGAERRMSVGWIRTLPSRPDGC